MPLDEAEHDRRFAVDFEDDRFVTVHDRRTQPLFRTHDLGTGVLLSEARTPKLFPHGLHTGTLSWNGRTYLAHGDSITPLLWDTRSGSPLRGMDEKWSIDFSANPQKRDCLRGRPEAWEPIMDYGLLFQETVWCYLGLDQVTIFWDAVVSADGSRVLVGTRTGEWMLYDTGAWRTIARYSAPDGAAFLAHSISPDGQSVVFQVRDRLLLYDDAGNLRIAISLPDGYGVPLLSTAGRWVIFFDYADERCKIWNAQTGEPYAPPGLEAFRILHWPHSGRLLLAAGVEDDNVHVVDMTVPGDAWQPGAFDGRIKAGGFSDDQRRVILVGEYLSVWDTQTRELLFRQNVEPVSDAIVAPDGNTVIVLPEAGERVLVYRRSHPEWWWGFLFLPWLHLSVLLGCVLLWSVSRIATSSRNARAAAASGRDHGPP
jgi:hypothetical protein